MQGKVFYIVALVTSLLLHALLVAWWANRPVTQPVALGVAPAVTVDLLAAPAPTVAPAPPPPPAPPPAPPAPPEPPVQKAEMAEVRKVVKKPEPVQPVQQPAVPVQRDTRPAPAVPVPPTDSPAKPAAAPAVSAARYDADYLDNPAPAYPPLSRRLGEEGKVILQVQVSVEGKPLQVTIKQSSGLPRLDKAALSAVERWRFVPARQGEQAVISWVDVPIQFSLKQ